MLIGLLLVENNITMLPNVGSMYYVFLLAALLYMLPKERISFGVFSMLGLYAVCLISLWVNDVPSVFQANFRFLTFLLTTSLTSPMICNDAFTRFRSQAFVTILSLLKYVVIASFVYALMGGGYFRGGYFQGVTNHSMMMGPFAALCALLCVYRLLANSYDKKGKMWYGIILLSSLFCLLQAASRAAFLAAIASMVVFFTVYYRDRMGKFVKTVAVVGVVLVLAFPLWGRYMNKLEQKNANETQLNVDSRKGHWEQRVKEFRSSPFWGIGFSAVSTTAHGGSTYGKDGKVESGSSWLSVLSMTGVFGFAAFLAVFLVVLKRAWEVWYDTPLLSSFLVAILCFWAMHMMAEGYIFAGGNSLAFCVWLTFGVVYGVTNNKELAYELQQKLAE